MMRAALFAAAATVVLGFATEASAGVVFVGYGGGIQPPFVPAGETAVDLATATGTFNLETGSVTNQWAAPEFTVAAVPTADPNQYIALLAGDSATIAFGGSFNGVEIYVGSLDSFNSISFSNGVSYTGAQLAAMTTATDDGNQTSGTSNGLFYFTFGGNPASSVTLSSGGNSLEVASVSVSAIVPEPATWAMMLIGFTGLGYAAFRQSAKDRSAVKAI